MGRDWIVARSHSPGAASRPTGWILAAAILLLAAWVRLRGIGRPEAFVDEGANILTALDSRVRQVFEPLEQGRPWLAGLFFPADWFPAHVLAAARMMTAGAGLATMAALAWTLGRLAGRNAALIGMVLWAFLPFTVFHERLALQDPFVAATLALALACVVEASLAEYQRTAVLFSVSAGLLFGAACLLKVSALLAAPWLVLFYFAVQRRHGVPLFDRRLGFLIVGALAMVATLGPDVRRLGSHIGRYSALPSLESAVAGPTSWDRFLVWLKSYAGFDGWPLLLLLAGAAIFLFRRKDGVALAAFSGWLITLVVAAIFYHNSYARYAVPDHVPLVIFLALALGATVQGGTGFGKVALALPAIAALGWFPADLEIGTDPTQAPVPVAAIAQYFVGPWSGNGLGGVREFVHDVAVRENVDCMVLTHRFSRPGCYGMMLAEIGDPRLGVLPVMINEPADLARARRLLGQSTAGRKVAFFILYEGLLYPPPAWLDQPTSPAHRVATFDRAGGVDRFTLYRFEP